MKKISMLFLLFSCVLNAVNYPPEQEKRGVKRHIEEIMPIQGPTAAELLVAAVHAGDIATMNQILAETGYTIDRRYGAGKTLLIHAAETGQTHIVTNLIERGANVNIQDQFGNTALHYAALGNYAVIVLALMQVDALQFNVVNNAGATPLLTAFLNDSNNVINLLLTPAMVARGLDINKADNDNFSPLSLAILKGDLPLVNRLLQLGVHLGFITPSVTVLQYAVARQRDQIVKRLLQVPGLNVNETNPEGETALMVASLVGNLNLVRQLLTKGALVKLKDKDGSTAIDFANASDSPNKKAIIKLLKEAGRLQ